MSTAQTMVFAAIVSLVVTLHPLGGVAEGQIRLDPVFTLQTNSIGAIGLDAVGDYTAFDVGSATYAGRNGSLQLLVQDGDPAPGAPAGHVFQTSQSPVLDASGQVTFIGTLDNTAGITTMDRGIWVGTPGSLQLLAGAGAPAPGIPDTTFLTLDAPRATGNGQSAFTAALTGAGASQTLWTGAPGSINVAARTGAPSPIPGLDYESNFARGTFQILAANNTGQLALHSVLAGAGVDTTNDKAVFVGTPDNLRPLLRTGAAAPGVPAATFTSETRFLNFALGDGGHGAFVAQLQGTGIDATNDGGLWAGTPDDLQLITRAGSPAPGLSPQNQLAGFWLPTVNASGQVAFAARLAGDEVTTANNEVLYVTTPQGPRLLARSGDPAPGTGWTFGALTNGDVTDDTPILSDDGWLFFHAARAGQNLPFTEDQGLFAAAPDGTLHLIAREGQLADIGGGDLREIHSFVPTRTDTGDLIFSAQYLAKPGQPGTGGLVVFKVSVPEPATPILLLTTTLTLLRRRRGR